MKLSALSPQRWMLLIALSGIGMLVFGLYLQHVVGLNPCPMCIVQRYALIGVVVWALLGWRLRGQGLAASSLLLTLTAGFGAFTAARQSWLQWYPPEVVNCGRDFYGMVENFPLNRAIPMIFKGSGDCVFRPVWPLGPGHRRAGLAQALISPFFLAAHPAGDGRGPSAARHLPL
jgi:disulfide bond formation protein DsbB